MLLLPCPFCGNDLNEQDSNDTIYPATRERDLLGNYKMYQIVCQENAGGCSATILGYDVDECIKLWNSRNNNG